MKKTIVLIVAMLFLTAGLLPAGCASIGVIDDSGPKVTKTYDFTGFTGIEAGNAFKVDVSRADSYSINITISEKIADRLDVYASGNFLHIGFKKPTIFTHGQPLAVVTMPDLRDLNLSGATSCVASGFKSSNGLNISLSGASHLDIDMEAGGFKADLSGASEVNGYLKVSGSGMKLSGASHITLTGTGGDINLESSGASNSSLANFTVGNADIMFSGASSGSVNVSGKLNANLSGASRLEYRGSPTMGKIEVSGGSSINPR
jgi:hypothetical protein